MPSPKQLNVFRQVFRHDDPAGGIDAEFLEVFEQEGADAEEDFYEEGVQVGGLGVEGLEGEDVDFGEEGVD